MPTRRQATGIIAAALMMPTQSWSQSVNLYKLQRDLINVTPQEFFAALEIIRSRDLPDMAAGLIASMRFTHGPTSEIVKTLADLWISPRGRSGSEQGETAHGRVDECHQCEQEVDKLMTTSDQTHAQSSSSTPHVAIDPISLTSVYL